MMIQKIQPNDKVRFLGCDIEQQRWGNNDFPPCIIGHVYTVTDVEVHSRDDLSKTHHDVVIFGLYTDYIQHSNTGLIDSSLTCDLKVNYLKAEMQNNLANLYSGQCDAIYRNKVLVMN